VLRLENQHIQFARCHIKRPRHGTIHQEEQLGGDHGLALLPRDHAGVTLEACANIVILEMGYAPQYSSGEHAGGMCADILTLQATIWLMLHG